MEKKCDKSEIDLKICFSFTDPCIELTLSDPVPDGWRLDPHAEPLKARLELLCLTKFYNCVYNFNS